MTQRFEPRDEDPRLLSGAGSKPSLVAINLSSREARDVSLGPVVADSGARAGTVFSTPDGKYTKKAAGTAFELGDEG